MWTVETAQNLIHGAQHYWAPQTLALFLETQTQNLGVFQGNVVNMWGANGNEMATGHLIRMEMDLSQAPVGHRVLSTPNPTHLMYW